MLFRVQYFHCHDLFCYKDRESQFFIYTIFKEGTKLAKCWSIIKHAIGANFELITKKFDSGMGSEAVKTIEK